MEIKVLGPGCAKCAEAEKIMRAAVEEAGVTAAIEKVSDFQQIAKHGVFSAIPAERPTCGHRVHRDVHLS